jgi:hypothetical protein
MDSSIEQLRADAIANRACGVSQGYVPPLLTSGAWHMKRLSGQPHILSETGHSVARVPVVTELTSERRGNDATLMAAGKVLAEALVTMLERYTSLVNCGDCGNWDPETEPAVIGARAALERAGYQWKTV